jgi:hypothetical protein
VLVKDCSNLRPHFICCKSGVGYAKGDREDLEDDDANLTVLLIGFLIKGVCQFCKEVPIGVQNADSMDLQDRKFGRGGMWSVPI